MGWTRTTIDISKWMGWDGEPTSPQPYTKSYGQLRNAESGQNGKEHTNGQPWKQTWITIIQTEQVIFRNICVYTYMCVTTVSEKKRSWIRKRERRGIWEGLGGDRGIKNCYNYNLNNKREKSFHIRVHITLQFLRGWRQNLKHTRQVFYYQATSTVFILKWFLRRSLKSTKLPLNSSLSFLGTCLFLTFTFPFPICDCVPVPVNSYVSC